MIKELLYKWFNIDPFPCPTCEVLKHELDVERQFNKVLFERLVPSTPARSDEDQTSPAPISTRRQTIPWQVKRELLENEDRERAKILRNISPTIEELEKDIFESDLTLKNPEHEDGNIKDSKVAR